MNDEKVEGFYQNRAKEFIDMLFDKGYFREDVTRDSMRAIEDFLAWEFQQYCKSALRGAELSKKVRKLGSIGRGSE